VGFAVLALLGATSWGLGDFLGGLSARRMHVVTVLVVSQAVGLAGVALWAIVTAEPPADLLDLAPAVGAGAAGAVGLGALYQGMAIGAMGIVAPISAASPIVPLAVDVARGVTPTASQWLGIAVVLAGIVLLAREPGSGRPSALAGGVALALVAALGFGLFVVGLDAASDSSVPWTIVAARSTSTLLALVVAVGLSVPVRPTASLVPAVAAVGIFDTAANVLVAYATTRGPAGVVAVLSALYPVVTVLLARLVLGEKLDRTRRIGGGLAIGGAALVAVG
jgi:drug/metabolite transporter (DMT)-like permease